MRWIGVRLWTGFLDTGASENEQFNSRMDNCQEQDQSTNTGERIEASVKRTTFTNG
jgi:hypothetical protein